MTNKELGLKKVLELVERFKEHQIVYKKAEYNETQTRRDFIDPLFKALGWDIDNEQGLPESYREVIHEDRIKISGGTKAPDYSFRLSGQDKLFFLEAKKPNINIKDNIDPSYQIKRYGWNAKMTISVLTDFEELSIYDCSREPNSQDASAKARLNYFTFDQYENEWDFLWSVLSKEAAQNGGFGEYLKKVPQKKGAETVDKRFLKSLDEWRTLLAETISKENKHLDEDELNYLVQQTLDRIIFLRICEDRSIEPYGKLKECLNRGEYYVNLLHEFQLADEKYNSGLFNLKKDKLSHQLKINNQTLKTIISQLYYPECPYEFSVLSVEILGSAYEQFLGKTITINNRGKADIELKPEVRKAGGVYYTPQYIVDYIVINTIGKLCEKKTPKEVADIKIIDPACGSGSFLIGAYQYLLNWHKDYYIQNPNKKNPLTPEGNLTTAEKKKILLNNIYGVDIDTNAVEVTKLSLLLKCMEGETQASIAHQMKMFNERVLPTLDDNIKSGNSLIDTDYYDTQLDFGEERKIKPFSWEKAYPTVFKNGGFDIVIGNPPWGADFSEESLSYLRERNKEIIVRMIDSFMYFVYKSYNLLKPYGIFGMILPDVLFYQTDNAKLREYILNHSSIEVLLNLGNVFENVTRPSCIIIFSNLKPSNANKIATLDLTSINKESKQIELLQINNFEIVLQKELKEIPNYLFVTTNAKHFLIIQKIKEGQVKNLSEFIDEDGIQRGVSPDLKEAFLVTSEQVNQFKLEKSHLKYVLTGGKQVKRFHINYPDLQLIYTKRDTDFTSIPKICNFIDQFKSKITCKEVKAGKHSLYSLHRAREERIFIKPEKLIGVITEDEIIVSIDNKKTFATDGLYLFGTRDIDSKYLMGILNSRLFIFLYRLITMEGGRALAQVKPTVLMGMPIRVIDNKSKDDISLQEDIIRNVNSLLMIYPELSESRLQTKTEHLEKRIEHHISKIDTAVYKLYNLTEEEIMLVEKN